MTLFTTPVVCLYLDRLRGAQRPLAEAADWERPRGAPQLAGVSPLRLIVIVVRDRIRLTARDSEGCVTLHFSLARVKFFSSATARK
jgi:hypothetical protein